MKKALQNLMIKNLGRSVLVSLGVAALFALALTPFSGGNGAFLLNYWRQFIFLMVSILPITTAVALGNFVLLQKGEIVKAIAGLIAFDSLIYTLGAWLSADLQFTLPKWLTYYAASLLALFLALYLRHRRQ